jgi:photosystem II stability/assembly factor-like uncharacterized protein
MRFHVSIPATSRVIFALFLSLAIAGPRSLVVQAQEYRPVNLVQFDLSTENSGWMLLDQRLFRTSDAGQTWQDISPSMPPEALVQDVEFKDASTGWILWTIATPDGDIRFQLAHTTDNGLTWTMQPLPLFEPGEIASNASKADMGWFDAQTGWISVKQNTGSNFSLGVLFTTQDGGNTWSRSALPVADKVYFSEPQVGWAVGGPTGDQIFQTENAGASWQPMQPADISAPSVIYPPFSSNGGNLLVMTDLEEAAYLNVYGLENSSGEWLFLDQLTGG